MDQTFQLPSTAREPKTERPLCGPITRDMQNLIARQKGLAAIFREKERAAAHVARTTAQTTSDHTVATPNGPLEDATVQLPRRQDRPIVREESPLFVGQDESSSEDEDQGSRLREEEGDAEEDGILKHTPGRHGRDYSVPRADSPLFVRRNHPRLGELNFGDEEMFERSLQHTRPRFPPLQRTSSSFLVRKQHDAPKNGNTFVPRSPAEVIDLTEGDDESLAVLPQGQPRISVKRAIDLPEHLPPSHGSAAASSNKKRKLAPRECEICCSEVPDERFPVAIHSSAQSTCRAVCFECIEKHIDAELERKDPDKVSCPQCSKVFEHEEITKLSQGFTGHTYQKWADKATQAYLQNDAEFRSCPSASCKSGYWTFPEDNGNIFRCRDCNYRHCMVCEVPMHEDETCNQYQERMRKNRHEEDELLSAEAVKKCSKPCPNCGVNIDKYTGCDHVTCRKCKHQFCWLCFASYVGAAGISRVGNSAHKKDCQYHAGRIRDYHAPLAARRPF